MAYHHVCKLLRVGFGCVDSSDVLTLSKDGHLIGNGHDFSKLMGDDDNCLAVSPHVSQDIKELICLLGSKDSCRLVENQDVCTSIENLYNLYSLLLGDRHIIDLHQWVDIEAILTAYLSDLFIGASNVHLLIFQTEDDVLGSRKYIYKMIVLMDHADAIGEGILRGTYGDFLTVGIDLSFVRLIYTAKHIHKGSLSTSVFAQKG